VAQKVQNIWNRDQGIVDEGTYFVATNTTIGTGIATTTSVVDDGNSGATSAQTRPLMIIQNGYSAGSTNPSIYPISLKLLVTAAPTSATYWQMALRLDPIVRYTSGGSTITPVNVNGNLGGNSRAAIYFGAITAAASSSTARVIANSMVNPTIPVVKDTMIVQFGNSSGDVPYINAATVNTTKVINCPPVVIPPGYSLVVEMWGASNAAAPAFEFQFDYVER
jgi:hypothetical protein